MVPLSLLFSLWTPVVIPVIFVFQVKELNHVLEAEKSCRTDLEMYVAVLNTQKSVLQEDAEKLRKELHEGITLFRNIKSEALILESLTVPHLFFVFGILVCHKLELERQQHNQLKHTWQRANDQFLESQRLLMRDMQRIESVLSSEQLRQVEEMKKKDQVHATPPFRVCTQYGKGWSHLEPSTGAGLGD